MFSYLLFTVLYTIISIISSTILKLHMGLVLFLDKMCSHEFIGGYPFFYFYCAGMSKQNHYFLLLAYMPKLYIRRYSKICVAFCGESPPLEQYNFNETISVLC